MGIDLNVVVVTQHARISLVHLQQSDISAVVVLFDHLIRLCTACPLP